MVHVGGGYHGQSRMAAGRPKTEGALGQTTTSWGVSGFAIQIRNLWYLFKTGFKHVSNSKIRNFWYLKHALNMFQTVKLGISGICLKHVLIMFQTIELEISGICLKHVLNLFQTVHL